MVPGRDHLPVIALQPDEIVPGGRPAKIAVATRNATPVFTHVTPQAGTIRITSHAAAPKAENDKTKANNPHRLLNRRKEPRFQITAKRLIVSFQRNMRFSDRIVIVMKFNFLIFSDTVRHSGLLSFR
jgi:hypothetical protein